MELLVGAAGLGNRSFSDDPTFVHPQPVGDGWVDWAWQWVQCCGDDVRLAWNGSGVDVDSVEVALLNVSQVFWFQAAHQMLARREVNHPSRWGLVSAPLPSTMHQWVAEAGGPHLSALNSGLCRLGVGDGELVSGWFAPDADPAAFGTPFLLFGMSQPVGGEPVWRVGYVGVTARTEMAAGWGDADGVSALASFVCTRSPQEHLGMLALKVDAAELAADTRIHARLVDMVTARDALQAAGADIDEGNAVRVILSLGGDMTALAVEPVWWDFGMLTDGARPVTWMEPYPVALEFQFAEDATEARKAELLTRLQLYAVGTPDGAVFRFPGDDVVVVAANLTSVLRWAAPLYACAGGSGIHEVLVYNFGWESHLVHVS